MVRLIISALMLSLHLVNSSPVLEYQDQEAPQMIDQPQKKWDKYGLGFGSDGFLYDFVKRTPNQKYNNYYGFGSDGYLFDFAKENPQSCKIQNLFLLSFSHFFYSNENVGLLNEKIE